MAVPRSVIATTLETHVKHLLWSRVKNMTGFSLMRKAAVRRTKEPGCIPCKVYAEDTPILTIDSIVICQTHAEDLRRRLLKMHPGKGESAELTIVIFLCVNMGIIVMRKPS